MNKFRQYVPFIIPALVLLTLIGLFARGLFLDPTKVASPLLGKGAPKFSLPQLQDAGTKLDQDVFQGKVSVLNVWGAWCGSCHDEHPVLVALSKRKLLAIYGLDYHDVRNDALAMLQKDGNPYDAVAFDASGDVAIDWGVYGAPETFVIDKRGIVREKYIGPLTQDIVDTQLVPLVQRLQAEPQ